MVLQPSSVLRMAPNFVSSANFISTLWLFVPLIKILNEITSNLPWAHEIILQHYKLLSLLQPVSNPYTFWPLRCIFSCWSVQFLIPYRLCLPLSNTFFRLGYGAPSSVLHLHLMVFLYLWLKETHSLFLLQVLDLFSLSDLTYWFPKFSKFALLKFTKL